MSSDVLERARLFVEEWEREQAEKDAILARYERVTIHGEVLVDGHHVFLEMLRDIETFNHYMEEHPKLRSGIRNIWLDPHPVNVAEATCNMIFHLQRIIPLEVAQQLSGSDKICISTSVVTNDLQEDASRYCAVESLSDILIFDARMPPAAEIVRKLEKEKRRICLRKGVVPLEIERQLALARAGRWAFWDDDGLKELPYGFKNEFLDVLTHPWHGWKEHLGKRDIRISRGRFRQNEKGVDACLVIAGCQAAADSKLDWTCLVTNDADYVPLVKHLQSRGKAVYLLSLGDPKRQSGDLKTAVGSRYLIDKAELYNGFREEPIPEPYRSKPAIMFLLLFCMRVELGARIGGEMERLSDPVKYMEFLRGYDDVFEFQKRYDDDLLK